MSRKRAKDNAPAFQFYVNDWLTDENLVRCSFGAQGFWMRVLCIMFKCLKRGRLITNNKPWTVEETAHAVGGDSREGSALLHELLNKGVCRVSARRQILWSPRMVRDERARRERARAGARGGTTRASKPLARGVAKGVAPPQANVKLSTKLTPPSSSSSSSSVLDDRQTEAREREFKAPDAFADPVIKALESRLGRQARPDEVMGITALRGELIADPVILQPDNVPANIDTVLARAVAQVTPAIRIPMQYIRRCVGTSRADGCLPGDVRAEIAQEKARAATTAIPMPKRSTP